MAPPSPSDWLVLVPTALEQSILGLNDFSPVLTGFGPVAAAASAAAAIAAHRPRRVLLVGIAGSFDLERLPIGAAARFGEVRMDQLGVGQGPAHISCEDLGFPQVASEPPLFNRAVLDCEGGLLITTSQASASASEAAARKLRHPGALAEDMEGFGVALACHMASLPLSIVRGISNQTGERDKSKWQIPGALAAASQVARHLLIQDA